MIIDKVSPYWQEDDLRRLEEIRQKEKRIMNDLAEGIVTNDTYSLIQNMEEEKKLKKTVESRYIKLHGKKQILADIEEIVNAIEKEDFLQFLAESVKSIASIEASGTSSAVVEHFRSMSVESYKNCFGFIVSYLNVQFEALKNDKKYTEKAISIVKERVALWYVEQKPYLPMLHGRATDAIACMTGRPLEKNLITRTASITRKEVKLVIKEIDKLSSTLGVSTHKLLSTAIAKFTKLNHTGLDKREMRYPDADISVKEYAKLLGYDIEPHKTNTLEDAEKEAKRAENALKEARKKINRDLDVLYSASVSWSEKVCGKSGDYMDVRLVEAKGIKNGFIKIRFSQTFANYLIKLPLTQYPTALLRVDERNGNAYSMGLAMTEHYNLDNNQIRGTAHLLKVSTLLGLTTLPTVDSASVKKVGWETRIKEPFENSLDALTACGLLEDWRYSKSNGVELTEEEATSFTSYEEWADTLVYFSLKDAPDHTARLEARAAEKETKKRNKKQEK